MDGSEAEVLLDFDLQWPNGLTFDPTSSMLYWCDTFLNRVERLNLTGLLLEDSRGPRGSSSSNKTLKTGLMQKRRSVIALDENLSSRPYGLAIYRGQLIYSEFVKGRIVRLDLETNETTILAADLPQLFEVP
jgi:sugar lactone lactonase YvrE